ncbi:MAG: glycosyltransferase family 2 protein [Candidatus Omnitrophica bacterium]|nr:glycosyltransferase family 2 protein [Candidatus Omnitrophota bacterium]
MPHKLIIQIPCYNEERDLTQTLTDLPRQIDGINSIEILIINDGSTDNTGEVARANGAHHIITLKGRRGLARAFSAGIDAALKLGADVIVNTDADNQYKGSDIPRLVRPILEKRADIVIGNRNIERIKHFSFLKKKFQRIGSWAVKKLSGLDIPDATTGFRAYSRKAALELNVFSDFTYTLETIMAAGHKLLAVENIEVETNPPTRPSRLFGSMYNYMKKSAATLIRIYTMYQPLKVFIRIGTVLFLGGFLIGCRFLYFFLINQGAAGHIQSLILAAILMIVGFQVMMLGMLADLIAANRCLGEESLARIRKLELDLDQKVSLR